MNRTKGSAALSRSGASHPLGKLDAELKTRISSATLLQLQVLAAQHDMPLAEFVRLQLDCVAFGVDHVASMTADRIRALGTAGVRK